MSTQELTAREQVSTENILKNTNSKWVEGLILLAVLLIVMFTSSHVQTHHKIIYDEQVSTWSGTIDNLE